MFESTCALPISSEVFCVAAHPTEPIVTIGMASGHVETYRFPAPGALAASTPEADRNARQLWRTRRHKLSCRALVYMGPDEKEVLCSAGADGFVKVFDPATGRVRAKMALPMVGAKQQDTPVSLCALTPHILLVGSDLGRVYVYDLESGAPAPEPTKTISLDTTEPISILNALPPSEESTTGLSRKFLAGAPLLLAICDYRKGVLDETRDYQDMFTSSCSLPSEFGRRGKAPLGAIVVGNDIGEVRFWDAVDFERPLGKVALGEGGYHDDCVVDSMAMIPMELGLGKLLAVGLGDGTIRLLDLWKGKASDEVLYHDRLEGESVTGLDFDIYGRMISVGGTTLKIWEELSSLQGDEEEEEEEEENEEGGHEEKDSDDDNQDSEDEKPSSKKREVESDNSDSDSDEAPRRKKKKKGRKVGPLGHNGVLKFEGLD